MKMAPQLSQTLLAVILLGLMLLLQQVPSGRARASQSLAESPSQAASRALRLAQLSPASELSFEFLNLAAVPSDQLCLLMKTKSDALTSGNQVNLLSLANNQIKHLNSSAFICIATRLRILNLRNNLIELISHDAFEGLNQLQVLLLDGNSLKEIPSAPLNRLAGSLHHLNLASNLIAGIEARGPSLELVNLISLSLKANPLVRVDASAFKQLVRLRTLTLSQVALNKTSGQLQEFGGLIELRHLHLDRLANLSDLADDYCAASRKLASLSVKSNQLVRVPRLAHCQALLSIDLSYNRIAGALKAANFSRLINLIDLYLSHNQLEYLAADAFSGLSRLQVLDLSFNKLAYIHTQTFMPLRASLYELNLAHNPDLRQLSHLEARSLDRLVSFKCYGNQQLRQMPRLPEAQLLAFTYAYHCCDHQQSAGDWSRTNGTALTGAQDSQDEEEEPLIRQLFQLILARVVRLMTPQKMGHVESETPDDEQPQTEDELHSSAPTNSSNISEIVLWPGSGDELSRLATVARPHDSTAWPEAGERRRRRARRWTSSTPPAATIDFSTSNGRLIDELIWQVKQIRFSHSVAKSERGHADEPTTSDAHSSSSSRRTTSARAIRDLVAAQVASSLARDYGDAAHRRKRAQDSSRAVPFSVQCLPRPDAFQPCRDLFDSIWLRAGVWLVFLCSFVGNLLVLLVLGSVRPSSSASALTSIMWFNAAHSKRHIDVPRFLVLNLALADLLMALYLGLLAFVDLSTLGEFRVYAIRWQHSQGCRLAGFLAVLSSELSVFILAIITLERNYAITNAVHLNRRLSLNRAMLIMLVGYLYALAMALLPLNGVNDYRKFSICLPLDFQPAKSIWRSPANLYLVTLVGINSFSFLLLVSCYLRMYCAIRGSQAWNTNDLKIAKRMSILVLTDFLCWIPLIFVASCALLGTYLVGPDGLKVLVIFVLPLNSIANPFLYAITTKKFKRDLKILKKRLRLGQLCEFIRLLFLLLTTCKRPSLHATSSIAAEKRRRVQLYKHATVDIRRNGHKHNGSHLKQNKNTPCVAGLGSPPEFVGQQLERRRAALLKANNLMVEFPNDSNGMLTGTYHHQPPVRKGSQLLARTIQLVRGQTGPNGVLLEDESRYLNEQANATCNQVTMNRTTCFSCQQRLAYSPVDSHKWRQLHQTQNGNSIEPDLSRSPLTAIGPRIVLETVEPPRDPMTPSEFLAQQQFHASSQQRPVPDQGRVSPASRQLSSELNDECQLAANQRTGGSPLSAVSSVLLVQQASSGQLAQHLVSSCQTIMMNERESRMRLKSAAASQDATDLEPATRSVSACAFVWPSSTHSSQTGWPGVACTSLAAPMRPTDKKMVSCSCDAIGQPPKQLAAGDNRNATPHLGSAYKRSLNKLVFGPFAKAWSTLQISLQSQRAGTPTAIIKGDHQATLLPQQVRETKRLESSESCDDPLHDDQSTILEDILQMSSPARRRLNGERRMSRSCEMITARHVVPLSPGGNSSSATNEPTSSSLYDPNDDQRILLATINQITTRRHGLRADGRKIGQPTSNKDRDLAHRRAACTRCRSWSPALLDKLEDCMHQIKSRLPKLAGHESSRADEPTRYKAMISRRLGSPLQSASNSSTGDSPGTATNHLVQVNPEQKLTTLRSIQLDEDDEEMTRSSDAERVSATRLESSSDDSAEVFEVDEFNEYGLIEWKRNLQRRAPTTSGLANNNQKIVQGRRLHQQLSGNSDTLSSRTIGTTFTNLSFDSSSSIPAVVAGGQEQQACAAAAEERSPEPHAPARQL